MLIKTLWQLFSPSHSDPHQHSHLPDSRQALMGVLRYSHHQKLIDADQCRMMEGILTFSDTRARDMMIPRAQMTVLSRHLDSNACLEAITGSAHSRFPVIEDDHFQVAGILLAKDMLRLLTQQPNHSDWTSIIRPALFVPESKRLDDLLRAFQSTHNHMAIVVDEYGEVAGLITIEDVIEQIIGDIEDESDDQHQETSQIILTGNQRYVLPAGTPITQFNDYFSCQLPDDNFDTVGGLVTHAFGHIPSTGDTITSHTFEFTILLANKRHIQLLEARPLLQPSLTSDTIKENTA